MFFPFQDYKVVAFSNIDDGDENLYTTEWDRALVIVEMSDIEIDGGEFVRIYANTSSYLGDDSNLFMAFGSAGQIDTEVLNRYIGNQIFRDNTQIRIESVNENNISGRLHVFQLPEL